MSAAASLPHFLHFAFGAFPNINALKEYLIFILLDYTVDRIRGEVFFLPTLKKLKSKNFTLTPIFNLIPATNEIIKRPRDLQLEHHILIFL